MRFNESGEALLRTFEGCKLKAYRDGGGILTIGYGHTDGVEEGMSISQFEAERLLEQDIGKFSLRVSNIFPKEANDNQFSAAVCFAFNVRNWNNTPLFEHLQNGDFIEAKRHWLLYDKEIVNGEKVESEGLKRRRQAELELFCKEVDT